MIKTLKDISKLEAITEDNVEIEYKKLKTQVKKLPEQKIKYSDIAKFVFDSNEENIEYFLRNIEELGKYAKQKSDLKLKKDIYKIINHIELESCRLKHLEEMQKKQLSNMIEGTVTNVKSMSEKIEGHDANIKEYKKEINNWYASIMTILGLFAAIVVTFFGGLGSITSIFNNINNASKYRLVFLILIVIFAMFNIIFMLLYYISIITNKTIYKECHHKCKKLNKINTSQNSTGIRSRNNTRLNPNSDSKNCGHKDISCSIKRYPFIFWFNILLILMMIIITGMYYFKL